VILQGQLFQVIINLIKLMLTYTSLLIGYVISFMILYKGVRCIETFTQIFQLLLPIANVINCNFILTLQYNAKGTTVPEFFTFSAQSVQHDGRRNGV